MVEELYEELPADQYDDYPEDLYEDLPANAEDYPDDNFSPPPLPSGPIPSSRPGGVSSGSSGEVPPPLPSSGPPRLPARATTTKLTPSPSRVPPKPRPEPNKRSSTLPRPISSSTGGGLDMNEILKKARQRSERGIRELEEQKQKQDADDETRHMAPWLNQLRKTAPPPIKAKPGEEEVSNHTGAAAPPWVRSNKEDVPEFIKKARSMSMSGDEDSTDASSVGVGGAKNKAPSPPVPKKPPVTAKPRLPVPGAPKQQPHVSEKPGWLKQRERQVNMATMTVNDVSDQRPPSPTSKPPPSSKPSPPLPNGTPRVSGSTSPPPVVAKRPRPVPAPRITSPKKEHVTAEQNTPPLTHKGSVMGRAKDLEKGASNSPPSTPSTLPPKPPVRTTPVQKKAPVTIMHAPSPPVPENSQSSSPPETAKEPAPPPPAVAVKSPAPPPPSFTPPPPSVTATQGEATPPMGSLQKFRRRPLEMVDVYNPPSIPDRSTKPSHPTKPPLIPTESMEIEDDIYDDTVGAIGGDDILEDETEELYDDLAVPTDDGPPPPPPTSLPPSSRPPPPSISAPPIPGGSEAPPPLPPPNIQTSGPGEEEDVYEMEDPSIDAEDETYEDLAVTTQENGGGALLPTSNPSASTLVPPSPQHSESSLGSGQPSPSPTLQRKMKLTKEEKKQAEEEKKREKERKKLEEKREKERKKKEELRTKNRLKYMKQFKQFPLSADMQHLFTAEALLDHSGKVKDHLPLTQGEILYVLLFTHEKLPDGKYLVEKEDGTIGYVNKNITQRVAYQSAQDNNSPPVSSPPIASFPDEEEDIYESLPQDENDDAMNGGIPAFPPQLPPPHTGARFPPPSHAPPPPPGDEPEELYEALPEDD